MTGEFSDVIKVLGKGKSGISSLVKYKSGLYVLKKMHDEKVPYYNFTKPKIELEIEAYNVLSSFNINLPKLIDYNIAEEWLLKEYIEGDTVSVMLAAFPLYDEMILEMLRWENQLKAKGVNIDYFPSNFVFNGRKIFYVDYEVNPYLEEWNYSNWGIYYWLNHNGFKNFMAENNGDFINEPGTGTPLKPEYTRRERERILNIFKLGN